MSQKVNQTYWCHRRLTRHTDNKQISGPFDFMVTALHCPGKYSFHKSFFHTLTQSLYSALTSLSLWLRVFVLNPFFGEQNLCRLVDCRSLYWLSLLVSVVPPPLWSLSCNVLQYTCNDNILVCGMTYNSARTVQWNTSNCARLKTPVRRREKNIYMLSRQTGLPSRKYASFHSTSHKTENKSKTQPIPLGCHTTKVWSNCVNICKAAVTVKQMHAQSSWEYWSSITVNIDCSLLASMDV